LENEYNIQAYCRIKNNIVSLNGVNIFTEESPDFSTFIKSVYKNFDTKYPKFFKMDNLSKLAFLAADILLKQENLNSDNENNIALVLSNKSSSLDTDRKHQSSIEDKNNYFPSPAVFVYTLPNICIGEISIKHKLFSENSFFIFDHFKANHLFVNAKSLLDTEKAEKVLCGWVDFDNDEYDGFLYLVAKKGNIKHNTNEITRLYKTI